jgi:hypothetical protein
MATKAQRVKAEEMHERAISKQKRRSQSPPRPEKPHNLGARAGRNATVAYEASSGKSSRKSTRASANRQRAASPLERTQQFKERNATARADRAKARAKKVGGKPRPT